MGTVLRSLTSVSPDLLSALAVCPPGSQSLVLHALDVMSESSFLTRQLVEFAQGLYLRDRDARFMLPVLPALNKAAVSF